MNSEIIGIEAQQAERPPFKRKEVGSSPTGPTKDLTAENVEPLLMELLKHRPVGEAEAMDQLNPLGLDRAKYPGKLKP